MRIRKASGHQARQQADWIVTLEPWRSLGYEARGLGRWLFRLGRAGHVQVAESRATVLGVIVIAPDVLLGDFIALLAVPPEAAAAGVGRALVTSAEVRAFRRHRWLYVSSDERNTTAGRFYRRLGFSRVARLPDLVVPGRHEILWRKGRDGSAYTQTRVVP